MKIENEFGYCYYLFDHDCTELYIYPEFRKLGKARDKRDNIIIEVSPKENSIGLEELILFYKHMGFKVYE